MHDGASVTVSDAINRHKGEASGAVLKFHALGKQEREELLQFLQSL